MKGFLKFLLIFASILLLSAFLAPLFYDLFQTFHPYKFERIFQRIVMILSLVAVVFFVRIKKDTWAVYGLVRKPQSPGLFATGFMAGILVLGLVGVLRVLCGQASFVPEALPWWEWILKFVLALGTGLLVGLLEEFFFRGFIFRSLMRLMKNRVFLNLETQ